MSTDSEDGSGGLSGSVANKKPFESNIGLMIAGWRGIGKDLKYGVRLRQMNLLYDQLPLSLFISSSIGTAILIYAALTFWVDALYFWGLLLLWTTGFSMRAYAKKRVSPHTPSHRSKRRLWRGIARLSAMGALWGSLALILPAANQPLQLTIIVALAGAGASGIVLLSAVPVMAIFYILSAMLPASIFMLSSPDFDGIFWMWILYTFALTQLSILLQGSLLERFRVEELRHQNERLMVENSFANAITDAGHLNTALESCLAVLGSYLGWKFGRVLARHDRTMPGSFIPVGIWSNKNWALEFEGFSDTKALKITSKNALLKRAFDTKEAQYIPLNNTSNRVVEISDTEQMLNNTKAARALIIPVLVRGEVEVLFEIYDDQNGTLIDAVLSLANMLRLQLGRAIERDHMEAQRQFLLKVLESVEDEIVACNADGLLYYNNDPQMLAQGNINPIPADDWPTHFELFHSEGQTRMSRDEIPLYRGLKGEQIKSLEIVAKRDGRNQRFIVNSGPMFSSAGESIGAVATMHNVSDMRRLQDQLLHAQKMEAVGLLTGGVAHDFNNVLMIAFGNLELLKAFYPLAAEPSEILSQAMGAIEKANKVTQQLLAISSRQVLHPGLININTCIAELMAMLSRTLGAGIKLHTTDSEDLWEVEVDAAKLESAVLNLALNARDAMDGQGNLSLTTENITICDGISRAVDLPHGDYVLISIEDTGRGILPDHLSRIFEPFFTTKELTGGTGLGLSMTHGFVRQSGGDLVVASELGRGTTFSLYLPRAESDDVILKSRAEKLAPTASSHLKRDVSKIVILVVEDEPALLSLICTALERRGFSTLRSADPQQAMRLIKENDAIDLVLSDIMMRGSDSGFEMASRIRQSRPKLPFIFMSGYADAAAPNGHQELGTFDVLSKPFDIQTLVDAVEKTLAAV